MIASSYFGSTGSPTSRPLLRAPYCCEAQRGRGGGAGVVPPHPSLVPTPLWPGHHPQPSRLPAPSPDLPAVNLTASVGRQRLAWWGRELLLKGAGRGCPRAPRLLPCFRARRGWGGGLAAGALGGLWEGSRVFRGVADPPAPKRQRRQVSAEGEEEVGAGRGGWWSRSCGRGRGWGSGLERASAAMPLASPTPGRASHPGSRVPHLHGLPAGAAASAWPRRRAQRWGNHEDQGSGERLREGDGQPPSLCGEAASAPGARHLTPPGSEVSSQSFCV